MLDWFGMHHSRWPELYLGGNAKAHSLNVPAAMTWRAFWGNLLFVQTVITPVFGSNASLWSLANEFWYYMLFPLGLLAFRREVPLWKRMVWLLLGLSLAVAIRKPLLPLFPVWLAGAALHCLPTRRFNNGVRWAVSLLYVPCVFLFAKLHMPDSWRDGGFGAITMLFLWALLSARDRRAQGQWIEPTRTLARFSFSLYVLHVPALMLITALLAGERRWSPKDPRGDALAGAVLVAVLLYSYGVARVTEFRTDSVRRWVERLLDGAGGAGKVGPGGSGCERMGSGEHDVQ